MAPRDERGGVTRRELMLTAIAGGVTSPSIAFQAASRDQAGRAPRPFAAQVLVFDTFGTVVDWRSSVIAEGEALGRNKGLTVDWAGFADAWRGGYGPSMNRVRRGELPWTKLDTLHRMVLDELLTRFKIDGLTEDEKVHFNRAWHRLAPWPDAVAGLQRLRKRFVIAPLSNGNLSLLTNMAKHAGLPWDCILSTELVRHYKPDRETYLMPAEFFDVKPSDVMMVAAHEGDLDAAKALGLKTAYVHRPREFGPARTPTVPAVGRFDYLAKDFLDLATQLGA
jgi:2-haloacid dehalogenase